MVWDAQLHYRQRAFASQVDWVLKTIEHFASRKDIQLAIRVHPAEVTGSLPSRQPIAAEIAAKFPKLPKNVALIKPSADVSTYALAQASDSVIIYATKTGIELAARGIPVIVAGESWLRGKEIGFDCDDRQAYETLLAALPVGHRLDAERTLRAQRYAYHFFFRRMIELPGFRRAQIQGAPYEIAAPQPLSELAPGASGRARLRVRRYFEGHTLRVRLMARRPEMNLDATIEELRNLLRREGALIVKTLRALIRTQA